MNLDQLINAELDVDCHCGVPVAKAGADSCQQCIDARCVVYPSTIECYLLNEKRIAFATVPSKKR